jgi:hypothetical protein
MTIRIAAARIVATVKLHLASLFDRGIEQLLEDFLKIDARLDAFAEHQIDRLVDLGGEWSASKERERLVAEAEAVFRNAVEEAEEAAKAELQRAYRVRDKLRELFD